MLFGKWLEETRKLQIESFGTDPTQLTGAERDLYLAINNLAARDELSEALGEHSWKPWSKTKGQLNRREYIKEHVDGLHFYANMLLAVQCTDEELNELYLEKMQVNRDRQAAGYENENKCSICKRALDDVKPSVFNPDACELCVPDVGPKSD
jgi:hypothetical protein